MNLEFYIPDVNPIVVAQLLEEQAERMRERLSGDPTLCISLEGGPRLSAVDHINFDWLVRPGYFLGLEVLMSHERYREIGIDWISEERPDWGRIPIEISPISSGPPAIEKVRVVIRWHPQEDIPEIRPYFMELMEPWEKAWGDVMRQLVSQAPILAFYNTHEPKWNARTEDWHFWFGYYEAVKGTERKIVLEYIAQQLGCSEEKVKNRRRAWKKKWDHELTRIRRASPSTT